MKPLRRYVAGTSGRWLQDVPMKPLFEHPLLRYQAKLGEAEMAVLELLKEFVYIHVISLPEVKGMEYKGQLIVLDLV